MPGQKWRWPGMNSEGSLKFCVSKTSLYSYLNELVINYSFNTVLTKIGKPQSLGHSTDPIPISPPPTTRAVRTVKSEIQIIFYVNKNTIQS